MINKEDFGEIAENTIEEKLKGIDTGFVSKITKEITNLKYVKDVMKDIRKNNLQFLPYKSLGFKDFNDIVKS